jgi:predicted peptidase
VKNKLINFTLLLFLVSCLPKPEEDNLSPEVEAGQTQTALSGADVTLSASASDEDGEIEEVLWTKIEGGPLTIINPTSLTPTLRDMEAGKYILQVTVTDDKGGTISDTVTVYIQASNDNSEDETPKNKTPIVTAQADTQIQLPMGQVVLTSTASDEDGSIDYYFWKKISGPSIVMNKGNTANVELSSLNAGTYVFEIKVTDNEGASASDTLNVVVNKEVVVPNQLPTVNAGVDQEVTLPKQTITFSATANDSDGSISKYLWTKVSGPSITMSGANSALLNLSNLVEGDFTFKVTVTDDKGENASDTVALKINPKPNVAPIVSLAAIEDIQLPADNFQLVATASDEDDDTLTYDWTQTGGAALSFTKNADRLTVSNLQAGTFQIKVVVSDTKGLKASDTVEVTILAKPNTAPIAIAGSNKTITLPTNYYTFTGSGSDADGDTLTFSWLKTAGPSTSLSGVDTAQLSATNLLAGTYTFQLTVTDPSGDTSSDSVNLVVNPEPVVEPEQKPTLAMFYETCSGCPNYWVALPKNYYTDSGMSFPVIQFYHGAGERGDGSNTTSNKDKMAKAGPFKHIKNGTWPDNYEFIIVGYQTNAWGFEYTNASKAPDYNAYAPKVLDDLAAKYRVNEQKIYVTGLSMGGQGSWRAIVRYPERYAAAAVVCGQYDLDQDICKAKNKPIWAFHGSNDTSENHYNAGVRAINNVNNCHASESDQMAYMHTFEGAGHGIWNNVYDKFANQLDGHNIYDWFHSMSISSPMKPPALQVTEPPVEETTSGGSGGGEDRTPASVTNNTAPSIGDLRNVLVKPGETVSIEVYASDNEDNQVIIDFAKALPNFTTIRDNGDGSATIEISPTAGDSGRKVYADVEASDDQSSELKRFIIQVEDSAKAIAVSDLVEKVKTPRPYGTVGAPHFGYYELVPTGFKQDDGKKWPFILFLHGLGEIECNDQNGATREERSANQLGKIANHGPMNKVINMNYPVAVFSPQVTGRCNGGKSAGWSANKIDDFVDFLFQAYPGKLDKNRMYVTGLSLGGGGTFNYTTLRPDRVAAAVPIAAISGGSYRSETMANTPVWAFHNYGETFIRYGQTLAWFNNFSSFGGWPMTTQNFPYLDANNRLLSGPSYPPVPVTGHDETIMTSNEFRNNWVWYDGATTDHKSLHMFTLFNKGGHNAWSAVYNDNYGGKIGIYDWMFAQTLKPQEIVVKKMTMDKVYHHHNEDANVTFTVQATSPHGIKGVFVGTNNDCTGYKNKLTSIGNNTFMGEVLFPKDCRQVGDNDVLISVFDNASNRVLIKKKFASLVPIMPENTVAGESGFNINLNLGGRVGGYPYDDYTWNFTYGEKPAGGMIVSNLATTHGKNSQAYVVFDKNWISFSSYEGHLGTGQLYDSSIQRPTWIQGSEPAHVSFLYLDPSVKYNVKLFSTSRGGGTRNTIFRINGVEKKINSAKNLKNQVIFSGVQPNMYGDIVIEVDKDTTYGGYLNAIELEVVP